MAYKFNPLSGQLDYYEAATGSGDVVGPASATDNAIARFDSTTGKLLQNSGATVDDSGNLTANNLSGTNTGDQNLFTTVAVSGQDSVVADTTTDTLTLAAGTNITITTNATTDTVTITASGGGLSWSEVTGTSQAAAINTGYIANNASLVTITLPDTAAVGSVVRVAGSGAGGWKIAQNASETIRFGNVATTTGTGGYLASSNQYDAVELLCITADTTWAVLSAVGNITYV